MPTGQRGVEVKGLRKIVRSMEKLGVETEDLKGAFTRIGARALSTANAGTPIKTGALLKSNRQSKRKNAVYLLSGYKATFYARFVHYGTISMPARPYLADAVRKDGKWAVNELEKELAKLINGVGL